MRLKRLEINGFKSFARKGIFEFNTDVSSIVGPNGSGKSNVAEAIRFVLGEQSMKSLRGKRGEDLIWNGSSQTGRSNQATVAISFDNTTKEFEIDYDEVEIKRTVFRDGTNQYFINGSQVRLRDIIELLAKVHIGATGHHIISQGEADRILNANIKERRTMIEEALGLKIYQWKIEESEKKLSKTEENIKQIESLRREIIPHLRFLKKQVEKVEKARDMREELKGLYAEYLKRESEFISYKKRILKDEIENPTEELNKLETKIDNARRELSLSGEEDNKQEKLIKLEESLAGVRQENGVLSRNLGRVEGMIEYEKKRLEKLESQTDKVETISYKEVKSMTSEINSILDGAEKADSLDALKKSFTNIRNTISNFISHLSQSNPNNNIDDSSELIQFEKEYKEIESELSGIVKRESELEEMYDTQKKIIEKEKDSSHHIEKSIFEMVARKSELGAILEKAKNEEDQIARRDSMFKEEIKEGMVLVGRDITLYENFAIDIEDIISEDIDVQESRRKQIEKIKIRLEDTGAGGGEDIMKEYEEVTERDGFLEREIEDLHKSATSLNEIIKDLTVKLDTDFKEGVIRINEQFQDYFALMFGGGTASLAVVRQKKRKRKDTDIMLGDETAIAEAMDEETEEGIDINVTLPRKKIKGLQMLSGGERALTSIALIFAVSQVNPPPFIVLDETDAALDEANSRKYGDMLENLSKHSQLIVITHNRETMSRAGILYGVTMGSDAVSKLLSVKFDEASIFAK